MSYYLVIALAAFILSVGVLMMKQPFFSLATSTTSLLNTMLDNTLDEQLKQKALIHNLGKLLSVLALFVLLILLTMGVSFAPVYFYKGSRPMYELDTASFTFYLCLLVGGGFIFLLPSKKKQAYSPWSVLLHKMVLDNYNISKSLFELDKKVDRKKTQHLNEEFVIVTGLARAGTTALTNLLFETGKFHSLSYANMPFLLATNLWRKVYNPKKSSLKERAHGDQVMFGYDTVEALEEYFFKAFLNDQYIENEKLTEHEVDRKTYENYLKYQQLVKKDGEETIYLAKNNNLILRYKALRRHNPKFKVLLMFRHPLEHANSLMKQHERFTKMQEKDPFVLSYMDWLGHHEFGQNQKVFTFDSSPFHQKYQPESINYWLSIWINYYNKVLEILEDPNLHLVHYHDLLHEPRKLLHSLGDDLQIEISNEEVTSFHKKSSDTPEPEQQLTLEALGIYEKLVQNKMRV